MALNLAKLKESSEQLKLRVFYGDEELEFYANKPTTEDRVAYRRDVAKCFDRRGNADLEKLRRVMIRWAKRMLTGFRKGDLVDGDKPLSPADPSWKDYLAEVAPEILEGICTRLFEAEVEVDLDLGK